MVRAFGTATAARRPPPDFLIIGTKRGGTTSLYHYVLQHPNVAPMFPSARYLPMRSDTKGVHYFDTGYHHRSAWYRSHFPSAAARRRHAEHHGTPVLTGEGSPYYLFHPLAPERARAMLPGVKLIVLLRNPVDRAFSHYNEQRRRGHEPLPTFEEAIDAEASRLAGEEGRLSADPRYVSFAHEHQSYVTQGRYLEPLRRWRRHFPAEQLLVLRSEDLYKDPQAACDEVVSFLALPPSLLVSQKSWNAAPAPEMRADTRRRLTAFYAPLNRELEDYLGRGLGWLEG